MSTLATNVVTLTDWVKRTDPNGGIAQVVEALTQTNEIVQDIPWLEGNLPTGHRTTIRTGMPTIYYRKLNQGVPSSKSTTVQVDDAVGIMEGYSKLDIDLAMLNGNTAAFRLSEDRPFMEQMSQDFASNLFYANSNVNPEKFTGLAARFGSSTAANGDNIIKGGGSGSDNTSIWLIGWGGSTVHGIYPKGSQAGLQMKDLGEDTVRDSDGNEYQAYRTHFQWKHGVTVRDWRYIVRICNIDTSDLTKNAATGADIIDLMSQAVEKIHTLTGVTPYFYVNRTVSSFLRRQTVNKVASSTLSFTDVGGRKVMSFAEVPVRRCDALLNTEATVA